MNQDMNESAYFYGMSRRLLHLYAFFCVFATLILICIGGIVTSTGSGLAVPDWPTSYGYNMFLFPFSRWFGDRAIFYEHTHRVVASGVGFLMIGLCVWLWFSPERKERTWLCWWGTVALILVIIQGILGGLRVTELNNYLGLVHGFVAQVFLVLTAAITLCLSKTWMEWEKMDILNRFSKGIMKNPTLLKFGVILTIVVFIQLIIGASMRHQHNGLAIPDFPLAYGKLWPKTDLATMGSINENRLLKNMMPVSKVQIYLHMTHRITACLIVFATMIYAIKIIKAVPRNSFAWFVSLILVLSVLVQFALGVWTVISDKAADIATAHVLLGAILLLEVSLTTILLFRLSGGAINQMDSGVSESLDIKLNPTGQNA
ncbi:MAG: COX15/CtaA family protein [Verrucomicrobiota bacterium]|nr:COX15/CtaA family protein [Verrucomicrobiota bacterium]